MLRQILMLAIGKKNKIKEQSPISLTSAATQQGVNALAEKTFCLLGALTNMLSHTDSQEFRTKPPQAACPCCP